MRTFLLEYIKSKKQIAVFKFGANTNAPYWWDEGYKNPRLEFLNYLLDNEND